MGRFSVKGFEWITGQVLSQVRTEKHGHCCREHGRYGEVAFSDDH